MRSFYYSFYRINSQFNDFLAQKIQKEEKSAMRNLKKILALALALVMSLSLMATANAFTDDDSITDTYETAVTVLSGLKVFQGYDDGSFLPQGAITRAEVAAIIYRIVTGDVADTQVGIYADYNKFDDVASTSWYAGYVNFCANAEYIKGYDARTFGPNDPVTGYQALAMILRALGYDKNGEFTGTNWTIQTAAVGEQRGITKNITAGTLNVPATREVVAEILFRAILVPTVNYTPAFGYTIGDTSLGYKTFGLEDITGVVVANEYADLYSASPMDEGETELNVDGESYTLAYATTVEDLGEARHAYVTGETVLAIADAGNTVWTNAGAETDIGSNSKFEDVTALEKGDAEEYVNFGGDGDVYESDRRIEYSVTFEDQDAKDTFAEDYIDVAEIDGVTPVSGAGMIYRKVIRAGDEITQDDLDAIRGIFAIAGDHDNVSESPDGIIGYVYVGTRSANDSEDVSNDMSYRAFYNEYITPVGDHEDVNGADNGEWLKVIDNDGDGEADYVFRVDFAMSVIDRISRDNEYTLAGLAKDDEVDFTETKIDGGDIVTEDELAEGDVVLYTYIDGVYYMSIAEMVTETVDTRGINAKTETMTCGGTEYVQSHIGYTDETRYSTDVTDAHTERTYDLYLDHFGYVRLLIESDYGMFMLLTDGYFETDRRDDVYRAEYWNVEAGEKQEIDVADNRYVNDFISSKRIGDQDLWRQLVSADEYYFTSANRFATTIAGYSSTEDGYALVPVGTSTDRVNYDVEEIQVTDKTGLKDEELALVDGTRLQTTTDTQYYLVIKGVDEYGLYVEDVITWTGYRNTPDEAALAEDNVGVTAYAVTHVGETGTYAYDIADVVVFETPAYDNHSTHFVYGLNNWRYDEYVWTLGYGEDGEIADDYVYVDEDYWNFHTNDDLIEFYEIYEDGYAIHIADNYDAKGIYAGRADVLYNVSGRDYIQVQGTAAGSLRYDPSVINTYVVSESSKTVYDVTPVNYWDDIDTGDRLIVFTDSDENVEYALWVEGSLLDDDGNIEDYALANLWKDIVADAEKVELNVVNNILNTNAPVVTESAGSFTVTVKAETGYEFNGPLYATVNNQSIPAVISGDTATFNLGAIDADSTVVLNGATKAIEYDIIYTGLDGATPSTVSDPVKYTIENKAEVLAKIEAIEPIKDSYDFTGWEYSYADTTNELGNLTCNATWNDAYVTLTMECYDEDGNVIPGDWVNKQELPEDKAATIKVNHAAKYSVNGEDQGYVLDGQITVPMDKDTVVVITYVDEYAVTFTTNDARDQWNHEWTIWVTDVKDNQTGITSTNDTTSTLYLKLKIGDGASVSPARELTFTIANPDGTVETVTKSVGGSSATFDFALAGHLTSEGYVITVTNLH